MPHVPPGTAPDTYYRERFRYALRIGLRGDWWMTLIMDPIGNVQQSAFSLGHFWQ